LDDYHLGAFPEFNPEDVVDKEVIEQDRPPNERTAARQIALQVLYEVDSAGHGVGDVLTQRMAGQVLSERSTSVLRQLVNGVMSLRLPLDDVIQRYAPQFPLSQVAIIDRNILRMAIYELVMMGRNRPQVAEEEHIRIVVDEAVGLARTFGAENTASFVNGVLGSAVEELSAIRQLLEPEA
jgi:N utilization substance protein B